jgi:hypothetical protein
VPAFFYTGPIPARRHELRYHGGGGNGRLTGKSVSLRLHSYAMAWIDKIRRDGENSLRFGMWADEVRLMEPRIEADHMARLAGGAARDAIGISSRTRPRLDKRFAKMMRWIGWERRSVRIEGKVVRAWVKPTKPGATVRGRGRPAGKKDAKPRQRRWWKRPEGVDALDWQRQRKLRGLS